jgi:hypothetical protein
VRMMGGVMGGDDYMGNVKSGLGVWKNRTGIARRYWMGYQAMCNVCTYANVYFWFES